MVLEFSKMNGAGNDFLLVDNRSKKVSLDRDQVTRHCDRQRGVGADGIILLVPSATGRGDWAWNFYNNDGSAAEMCGNGARCFARFVKKVTGESRDFTFETGAGVIEAAFQGDRVTVGLTKPTGLRLNEPVELSIGTQPIHSLNTGVPHAVLYVPDVSEVNVAALGREIRRHPHFAPKGTNINFAQILGPGHVRVRTYERGVEAETLACGTGVTATALISSKLYGFAAPVRIEVRGGDTLEVGFSANDDGFSDVRLTGPADFVFEGTVEL